MHTLLARSTAGNVGYAIGVVLGLGIAVALIVVGSIKLSRGARGGAKAGWIIAIVIGALLVLGSISNAAQHAS